MLKKWSVALLVLALAVPALAAETNLAPNTSTNSSSGSGFMFGSTIGAVTIDGKTYTQIIMKPDLKFDKFGIGLDLNFEFDENGKIREGEWKGWQAIVNKIRYLQYGDKGEKVFVKLGNIDYATIGHGTILDGFSNALYYPDIRLLGWALDLDFGFLGFESFVPNILHPDFFAGRLYVRPLQGTGIPILSGLEVGATWAKDFKNQNVVTNGPSKYEFLDADHNHHFAVYGFDLGMPILRLPLGVFTMDAFADWAQIEGQGSGTSIGVQGKIAWLFNYRAQLDRFSAGYRSPMFDYFYLANRADTADPKFPGRYQGLAGVTNAYNGWKATIWRSFSIMNKDDLTLMLQYMANDTDRPSATFRAHIDRKLLFNKVEFDLLYIKKEITSFKNAITIEDENSIVNWKIGYMIAENVMLTVLYTKTFAMKDGVLVGQESTAVQTELKF